jgi:hypothetical protein
MAQINLNEENYTVQNPSTEPELTVEEKLVEHTEDLAPVEIVPEPIVLQTVEEAPALAVSNESGIIGLSVEELNDPSKINVTIADKDAPIVVLFGPPACGKTMTLVRLARYLNEKGYTVSPVRSFRPTYDTNYTYLCDHFDTMINQDDAAESTDRISFMLVKVIQKGRTICQILEAPGELYFNPGNPNAPFPRYLNAIKSSRCRKVWTIMVEPDWQNEQDRLNYVTRIKKLKTLMTTRDRAVIVYNKIDKTEFLINGNGQVHMFAAVKNVRDMFPGIFEPFRNTTPILSLFTPYRCDFVPFQTGDYSLANDGTSTFEPGPDEYPSKLWRVIMKHVKG